MSIAGYIVDDAIFQSVEQALARAGFICERYKSQSSLLRITRGNFELIVIDVAEEPEDDDGIFPWLKRRGEDVEPVLTISLNAKMVARVLDAGADDFVAIPFEPIEFVARANALLRRYNRGRTERTISVGGFLLNHEANKFSYCGTPIELTPREFTMAWLFFSAPGSYISRETIGTAIWGAGGDVAGRTIEQHVYKLRKKLQIGTKRPATIRTAYGQGYRLELELNARALHS